MAGYPAIITVYIDGNGDVQKRSSASGAAEGDILYFDQALQDWVILTPGTAGQFLKTQGVGAPPVWDAAGGGGITGVKSGILVPGDFSLSGGTQVATVNFSSAYPTTNYTITVSFQTINNRSYGLRIENKTVNGFDVDLGSKKIAPLVEVYWQTLPVGET